jgi:hypothetical protein
VHEPGDLARSRWATQQSLEPRRVNWEHVPIEPPPLEMSQERKIEIGEILEMLKEI